MSKNNYVDVIYGEKRHISNYPNKFARHIFGKYMGGVVMDIGCGDGRFSKAIERVGFIVIGIDRKANDKVPCIERDLTQPNYSTKLGCADIVFTKSVIEHLHDPKILMDEAYRMLKPGGTLICLTPSWKHHKDEAFYADYTHVTPFTRRSLFMLAKLSGFTHIDCDYFYQLPKLWKFPWLKVGVRILQFLNLPYRPFHDVPWPDEINKMLQFSKEAMLLCVAKKPLT